jgi:hypothetical protein
MVLHTADGVSADCLNIIEMKFMKNNKYYILNNQHYTSLVT